jgi:biotin synthase
VENAIAAKENGSTRFCMGAAWRKVQDNDMPELTEMIKTVKDLGMETCMTLGTVTKDQAVALKNAGLNYYNHNIDTSRDYYKEVITTRSYDERLETLRNVAEAGLQVCCGGIMGMGESEKDRIDFLMELANMEKQPDSVPINQLIAIKGTPLYDKNVEQVSPLDFVRTIATARILMPQSYVRLSAGRESMSDELQAMCFFAGANSIFSGEKLLTTGNRGVRSDKDLLEQLGMSLETLNEKLCEH